MVETDATHNPGHIVLVATIVLAVVVFALRMFSLIERTVPGTPTDLPPA